MGTRADDFLAELNQDADYQARKKAAEESISEFDKLLHEDEAELIKKINGLGLKISSVWDFVNSDRNYFVAVPVLKQHLHKSHHPRTLAGIVRALAMKELQDDQDLWDLLLKFYRSSESDSEIHEASRRGFQEAVAVCLSALTTTSRIQELKILVDDENERDGEVLLRNRINQFRE